MNQIKKKVKSSIKTRRTVGLLPNRNQIQSIIKKVNLKGKKGMLIELDKNPQEIAGAFKKVAQIITGELNIERL